MNRKQRERNRRTANQLRAEVRQRAALKHTCENCGERGFHWVQAPQSVEDLLMGVEPKGFWLCSMRSASGPELRA